MKDCEMNKNEKWFSEAERKTEWEEKRRMNEGFENLIKLRNAEFWLKMNDQFILQR